MQVQIWSDVVCPWCYVGKRRFERALEAFAHRDQVEIVHRSFQLDPAAPRDRTTKRREGLMRKYNLTAADMTRLDEQMKTTAAAEGLDFLLDDGMTGNTLDAHRVLHFARESGRQDAAVERFFRAYFVEGRSVFDADALVSLAAEAGLDPDDTRAVLASDRFADAVAADIDAARAIGVTGVPFFVVAGRFGVSGAQASTVFGEVLSRGWELS